MTLEENPELLMCGMGQRLGYLSIEAFNTIKTCEHIYCINLPKTAFEQVKSSFKDAEDVTSLYNYGDFLAEEEIMARIQVAFSEPKGIAVLFLGHPLLYSLTPKLMSYCAHNSVRFRILSGLSSMEIVLTVVEPYIKGKDFMLQGAGIVVHKAAELLTKSAPIDNKTTVIVLDLAQLWRQWPGDATVWERLVRHLKRYYAPGHMVHLVECNPGSEGYDRYVKTTMDGLEGVKSAVTSEAALFIPMIPKTVIKP